jgi:hypothetical protein
MPLASRQGGRCTVYDVKLPIEKIGVDQGKGQEIDVVCQPNC